MTAHSELILEDGQIKKEEHSSSSVPSPITVFPGSIPVKADLSERLTQLRTPTQTSFNIPTSEALPEMLENIGISDQANGNKRTSVTKLLKKVTLNTENDSNASTSEGSSSDGVKFKTIFNKSVQKLKRSSTTECAPDQVIKRTNSNELHSIPLPIPALQEETGTEIQVMKRVNSDDSDIQIPLPSINDVTADEDKSFNRPLDKTSIPEVLISPGIQMLRVTHKKKKDRILTIDVDNNLLRWSNKESSYLEIDKIKSIRTGIHAKNYREEFKVSADHANLWITIIYHNYSKANNIKALHLIATDKRDFDTFLSTLKDLVFYRRQMVRSLSTTDTAVFTKFHWDSQAEQDKKFYFSGALKLCAKHRIHVDDNFIKKMFNKADKNKRGYLTFDEFQNFVDLLIERKELGSIFRKYQKEDSKMSIDDFYKFLKNCQEEIILKDSGDLQMVFEMFDKGKKGYLDSHDFSKFLSKYTACFKEVREDYTRPLNEYFISSSHNTYLLGRQINGVSSIEGYIRALQRGCRCVEIDIWDGENEPLVTHGRTLTNSITFRLVIETIRKYSFITSPYPVILSLEVRCNPENQIKSANILREVLEDLLVTEPIFTNTWILPSPEDLKHKILVKVKKPRIITRGTSSGNSFSSSSNSLSSSTSASEDQSNTTKSSFSKIISRKRTTVKMTNELGSLGVYLTGSSFRNFSLPESKTFNHCFSLNDKKVLSMLEDEEKLAAIMKHNSRFLIRLYPSAYRYKSNNFNPILFWEVGAQIVATNWQLYDAGQQLNEAMFNIGTDSGYVLKPEGQRTQKKRIKKEEYRNILKFSYLQYAEIEIISGQQLPKPKDAKDKTMDPYIELEFYNCKISEAKIHCVEGKVGSYKLNKDTTADELNKHKMDDLADMAEPSVVFRTAAILRNGFNPIWKQRCKTQFYSNENNLTFVRFLVKCATLDQKDNLIGVFCTKLSYLKQGYRHIPIYDIQGEEYIYSTLFVHIKYGKL